MFPALFYMALLLVVGGTVIEIVQGVFTVRRSGELLDALANTMGAFLAIGLIRLLYSDKSRLNWEY